MENKTIIQLKIKEHIQSLIMASLLVVTNNSFALKQEPVEALIGKWNAKSLITQSQITFNNDHSGDLTSIKTSYDNINKDYYQKQETFMFFIYNTAGPSSTVDNATALLQTVRMIKIINSCHNPAGCFFSSSFEKRFTELFAYRYSFCFINGVPVNYFPSALKMNEEGFCQTNFPYALAIPGHQLYRIEDGKLYLGQDWQEDPTDNYPISLDFQNPFIFQTMLGF